MMILEVIRVIFAITVLVLLAVVASFTVGTAYFHFIKKMDTENAMEKMLDILTNVDTKFQAFIKSIENCQNNVVKTTTGIDVNAIRYAIFSKLDKWFESKISFN